MLYWVGVAVIHLKHREAKVLWNRCALDFLDEGEPQRKLSAHSSFVLIVLWRSSILWFTRHSCALKELMESTESVSGSNKLWTDELGVGASRRLATPWKALGVTSGVLRFGGGGVSPGSLNRHQYRPGVCKGRYPSLNKGSGGCGASPKVGCVTGGTFSLRLPSVESSFDIMPSF
ncbi:hypothetical protein GW17_00019921 [Ensete ventricosum]|nr:hypothetical protein GW17_00019921 [Ensete ventricosum]